MWRKFLFRLRDQKVPHCSLDSGCCHSRHFRSVGELFEEHCFGYLLENIILVLSNFWNLRKINYSLL